MTHCTACGRALKNPPTNGMGPVFAARANQLRPADTAELFFDLEYLVLVARASLMAAIEHAAELALVGMAQDFARARERLGIT